MPQPLGTEEKITFVHDLTRSVVDTITDEIRRGKIPESWTGLELREYLFRAFEDHLVGDIKTPGQIRKSVRNDSSVLGLKY
jgi:hypothetical protein